MSDTSEDTKDVRKKKKAMNSEAQTEKKKKKDKDRKKEKKKKEESLQSDKDEHENNISQNTPTKEEVNGSEEPKKTIVKPRVPSLAIQSQKEPMPTDSTANKDKELGNNRPSATELPKTESKPVSVPKLALGFQLQSKEVQQEKPAEVKKVPSLKLGLSLPPAYDAPSPEEPPPVRRTSEPATDLNPPKSAAPLIPKINFAALNAPKESSDSRQSEKPSKPAIPSLQLPSSNTVSSTEIVVDILTPAYKFPSSLTVEEIKKKCQQCLSVENENDLELFSVNGGRMACLLKNSSNSHYC